MVRRKGRDTAGGALLPGYADLHEIGGGAFATVYKAVEVETGRPVALKILKVDTIHPHLITTFHQEIQALAAVSDHPNIVTLYRPTTTSDGRPVLVLELCRESLGQRLRTSGPLSSRDVTSIGIKVAGALETAHRNGFLHRDMKPQNILLTQFGEPALADFGVAALQASAQMTAGVFGFTTLHAAPEMLEGHHLSPATDVYGLASTMYQLLAGQAPFSTFEHEAPASVILRILRDPVRPLRAEHIPLQLADLLEAALAKQPEGRPRSAADFASALRTIESAQGWPETSFVAWGDEETTPPVPRAERGPMGVRAVPPLLPPPSPRPASPPQPASSPESGSLTRSPSGAPSAPLPPPAPAPAPPSAPPGPPPPPPMRAVAPSIATPELAHRNVVGPVEAISGRQGPRPAQEEVPPQPQRRAPVVGAAESRRRERPTFADPEPPPPRPRPQPVDDARARTPERTPGRKATPPPETARSRPAYAAWSVAAIAVAVLVIIAAALVVAGVI